MWQSIKRTLKDGWDVIGVLVFIALFAWVILSVFGCSSIPNQGMDNTLKTAERVIQTAEWMKPLSDGVVLSLCEGSSSRECVTYKLASSSIDLTLSIAEAALLRYRGEPSELNAKALSAMVARLKIAIRQLDNGYKGRIK